MKRRLPGLALVLLGVYAAAQTPLPTPQPTIKDRVYVEREQRALKLDLYRPDSDQPRPVVIWIHGGGWSSGGKEDPPVLWLLEHGYAVASVEYRFSQEAIFPAQIHDVKEAVRYLRRNATELGIDPTRLAAAGASAGGHLAALLGTSAGDRALHDGDDDKTSVAVRAVVVLFAPTDFRALVKARPTQDAQASDTPEARLLGGPVRLRPDAAELASPITFVDPHSPPFLILHGTLDRVVPLEQSELLHAALLEAGVKSQLVRIEQAGHGGAAFATPEIREKVVMFLDRHLR